MRKRSNGNKIILIILIILLILSIYALYKTETIINPKENIEENNNKTNNNDNKKNDNKSKKENDKDVNTSKENNNKTESTYLENVSNNTSVTIKDGWQETITKYLDLYTKSLVTLETNDVTNLFTDPNSVEAYLTQTTIDFQVEHHKMQVNDMKLSKAKYDIEYKNISIDGNKVTIKFLEDDYYKFNFIDKESKIFDVENTIVLRKSDDKYTIDSIRVVRDNYVMFSNVINPNRDSKAAIDNLKIKYLSWDRDEVEENKRLADEANKNSYVSKSCDHPYDRNGAVAYAMKYANGRNNNYYDYSSLGGNCANYGSQSIYAGGIPMDTIGAYQWKYYGSSLDTSNTKNGRSNSWTSTSYFYDYAKNNTGSGMCTDTDVNIFYAEGGDIIQVGYSGYTHTTIVVDRVLKDGKVVDILLNSNTVGLENYPLLGYTYQNKRLIKILGYND